MSKRTRPRFVSALGLLEDGSTLLNMRAARLLQREVAGHALTLEEQVRKRQLRQTDAAIEAIRAASNRLEAMRDMPVDHANDRRWPNAS